MFQAYYNSFEAKNAWGIGLHAKNSNLGRFRGPLGSPRGPQNSLALSFLCYEK